MLKKYSDFRHLFSGRLISNCGDSIYVLVLSWYILEVTKSTMLVGLLNSIIFLPNAFSFMFGKAIDRWNKKKTLILLEFIQLIAVLVIIGGMAIAEQFQTLSLVIIFFAVFIAATASTNTYTVQDAYVPALMPKEDLPKAEMYMSFAYNGTDYVFTSIAGFLLAVMSYMSLLVVDVITFVLSILTFGRLDDGTTTKPVDLDEKKDILSGFKVLMASRLLRTFAFGAAFGNLMFGGLNVYTLTIGKDFGGSSYFGLLTAGSSIGIMIGGTFVVNFVLKYYNVGRILWIVDIIFGLILLPISIFTNKYMLLLVWFIAFIFLGVSQVVQKPILQAEIPHEKMGEVISAFSTLTISTLSLGSLLFGYLAKFMDWKIFMVIFGMSYVFIGLLYFSNKQFNNYSVND